MRKTLDTVTFEEMKDKTFTVIQVTQKLCEFCEKPLRTEERAVKTVRILDYNDYTNLQMRSRAHDRVEVDLEENKIYLYHHDYPGDVHPNCVEKL